MLEGAIPLSIANQNIRNALGELFTWKLAVLVIVVVLSIIVYRPFCKWLCPLGALYALFNRVSLFRMAVDKDKCISCGKCARVCKMDVDVTKTPNHTECIRCGKCVTACPTEAVRFCYGFGDYKNTVKKTKTENAVKTMTRRKRMYAKKIIAVVTAVLLICSLAACSVVSNRRVRNLDKDMMQPGITENADMCESGCTCAKH